MAKENFGERLAVVSKELPYADLLAENPIFGDGLDMVDYFTHLAIAQSLRNNSETRDHPFIAEFIETRQEFYGMLSGRINNESGPLMEETTISQDILLEHIEQRYEIMPDELKKLRKASSSPLSGIGDRFCYSMTTHHLSRQIGGDQREEFFLVNDPDSPNALSEFYRDLNPKNREAVKLKYEEWKEREEPKFENGRSSFAGHEPTVERILEVFSNDTGVNYHGYNFRAGNPKQLELGVHPTGALMHKFWLNTFK